MRNLSLAAIIASAALLFTSCETPSQKSPSPAPLVVSAPVSAGGFELKDGDRVVFLGDTFIEREQHYGWIELMLTTRFPDRNVTFRNLGWSADTPAGDSRFGLSLKQAGHEPADEGWTQLVKQLEDARPTVVFVGYGMASSFDGEAGLPKFKADYNRLLDTIEKISPGVRLVLLGPVKHENLEPPWPNAERHNQKLALYDQAIQEIAKKREGWFISLSEPALLDQPQTSQKREQSAIDLQEALKASLNQARVPMLQRVTDDGIHLNHFGYRMVAERITRSLGLRLDTRFFRTKSGKEVIEPLRAAILRKNEWFFHRSRPANMAYIFGFRKREQGQNAVEIPKFDEFIAAEEKRIALLRSLKPGVTVPEIPRRVGNLTAKFTPQPHPDFEVADGFEVTLWAENPLLNKPIQMNFDPQGRLWVASSEVYPQIEPGQAATDKIIVLEDTNGDGKAEKATVFADGLLIPTGVEPGDGGVYVAQSTELLHFKDTTGDGKADVRRIVLSGFGTEDTHHNLHTLRWGFDGRLYMNQSIYTRTDTETPHGVVRLKGGGVFRFDPRDLRMSILFEGWINSWGHQFDDYGQSFLTDGAGSAGINYGLPGASYVTAPKARRILGSVSPGSYPKFSGIEIIRSAHFPDDWQGDVVTCDFRAHRVVRFKMSDQGSAYVTKEMPDLLRTTDATFRPIDVKLGPDGALYIADWSNPIIQHGEVDFRDPRRDKEHGRIWRVTAKGKPLVKKVDFAKLNNAELLDKLVSPNSFDAQQAKRILVERGADKVLKDLAAWTKKQTDEKALLNALWMHESLNQPQPALLNQLLAAKDARVLAAAIRMVNYSTTRATSDLNSLIKLVADENPRVRLEAVRALGKIKSVEAASAALTVLNKPMDPFLDYALWLTINELAEPWIAALKSGAWKFEGRENQLEFGLKAIEPALASEVLGQLVGNKIIPRDGSGPWIELIGSAGTAKELRQMFDQLLKGEFVEPASLRVFAALGDATRLRGVKPAGELATFGPMLKANNERVRIAALQLAGTWKLAKFTTQMIQAAGDAKTSPAVRAAALTALRDIAGPGVVKDLQKLAGETQSSEIRREVVTTLAGLNFQAALPAVITTLKATTNEAEAATLWRALLGIRGAGAKLAAELPTSGISADTAKAGLRPAREGNQNQALVQVLMQLAGLTVSDKQLTPAELQQLAAEALAKGDAARGERIYRRAELACMTCHAIGGAGGKVGPDMTSIGASAPADYLVEAMLYPNAKIKEGFHSVLITTKDEQEFSGIVVKESDNEVVIRNAANQEVSVAKKNIAKRQNGGSLMPSGLVDALLPEERLDLIKFLSMLGKPGDYDAAKGGAARVWRLYMITSPNQHLGVEPVVKGDFTLKDWQPVTARVNGALAKEDLELAFPARGNTRGLFAATQFNAAKAGKVNLSITGKITEAWLNGKPVKPAATLTLDAKAGVNVLVLQIDETNLPDAVRVASGDVSFLTN
ncbi:MAG: HEAT repeat domain-containing protein [Verrucomicrobia bacterium]|nr:HEAT repeat domain-containing protein [Verrucomicrobiota bacterium]